MVDLFSLAGVQDTARVMAGKLPASVAVLNDLDETGVVANIGAAEAVLKAIGMPLAPTQIYHRPAYTAAIAKGLSVTELGAKQQAAADAIRELWACPPPEPPPPPNPPPRPPPPPWPPPPPRARRSVGARIKNALASAMVTARYMVTSM